MKFDLNTTIRGGLMASAAILAIPLAAGTAHAQAAAETATTAEDIVVIGTRQIGRAHV